MGLSSTQVSNDVQDWSHGLIHSPSHESGSGSSMEFPNPPNKRREQQDQDQDQNLQPPTEKLKCPRCDSTNTKFCYYNNYNKKQPRHFCKACKRHWTKGGILRNVPVGGDRKSKRLKTTTTTTKNTNINLFGGKSIQDSSDKLLRLDILRPQFLAQESLFSSSNQSEFNHNISIYGGSSSFSIPQNHDLQFPCPSFITLDDNFPCLFSGSAHISSNLSVMNGPDRLLNDKPWQSEESTNNWGWEEIDKFVTADITLPWDDSEIIEYAILKS